MPSKCAYNEDFTITHALHCIKGGYIQVGLIEVRDTFAKLLSDINYDVETAKSSHVTRRVLQ